MDVAIRPATEADQRAAKRICHLAFGTVLGAPDPENFRMDRDYVYRRFGAEHAAGFVAEIRAPVARGLGDTLLTRDSSNRFPGSAICPCTS